MLSPSKHGIFSGTWPKAPFNLGSIMKKVFLSLVSSMLVLHWLVVGEATAKTINVAYPSPSWNTSLPVSMAKEFGLFAAVGLEVQPVYVRGGPVVMAALLGGDADFAVIAGGDGGHQHSAPELILSLSAAIRLTSIKF